ncbi:MAG: PHB depolymerase family esterase [Rhizobiales bacterium]|nr:PHB depolymerase family esterase [Hyphomicrobiales bacterium]
MKLSLLASRLVAAVRRALRGERDARPAPYGGAFEARVFSGDAGRRDYKLFIPAHPAPAAQARLIVMLHGCTQTADDFALGSGMNLIAATRGWHVLYPQQGASANPMRCWNWFRPGDQTRERGEPAIIAGMTRAVMSERDIPPGRVAVAGLSAGGAMALVLGAVYPELYEAVGVHSGVAFGAARDVASAMAAMKNGAPGRAIAFQPRLFVVQGEADATVNPANADAIVAAALAADAPRRFERGRQGRAFTRMVAAGADGRPRVEALRVEGLGHAWSGGRPGGTFVDPQGPDASAEMARFFEA